LEIAHPTSSILGLFDNWCFYLKPVGSLRKNLPPWIFKYLLSLRPTIFVPFKSHIQKHPKKVFKKKIEAVCLQKLVVYPEVPRVFFHQIPLKIIISIAKCKNL